MYMYCNNIIINKYNRYNIAKVCQLGDFKNHRWWDKGYKHYNNNKKYFQN